MILVCAILVVGCTATTKEELTESGLKRSDFQTEVDGEKTDLFVLKNKNNMEVCITNFGGRIVSVMVPDKDYFRNTGLYPQILQKSKHMMLNYYQIDQFTRRTVSLLEKHGITCFVMKGISLAASYPVPEYRKLGDLDLYINDKDAFHCAEQILHENGYLDEEELSVKRLHCRRYEFVPQAA